MTDFEFYQSVKKTDPKYVKNQNVGGRKISTIDPTSQTENATEAWGLYGKKWGIKDISFHIRMYGTTEVMTLNGIFWYPDGEFPYAVSDKSFYVAKSGSNMIDTDIEKKLLTSFKSKCLSLVGFNSDVFLGLFDDVNYVNEMWDTHNLISEEQRIELSNLIQNSETDAIKFNNAFAIDKLSELPLSSFEKAKAMLLKKIKTSENK